MATNMPWFALFFLLGDLAVQYLKALPDTGQLIWIVVLALLSSIMRSWRILAFCLGFCWTAIFAQSILDDRLDTHLNGKVVIIKGIVADIPHYQTHKVRFDFIPLVEESRLPAKIRLNWYYPDQLLKAGQVWRLAVKLKTPHGYFNPGGFDYEKWLFSQRIGATGYVKSNVQADLLSSELYSINAWRQYMADRIDGWVTQGLARGVIKALAIGDRSDLNPGQWTVFRRTGTAHLIAISGLHIGLIAGVVYYLIWRSLLWVGLVSVSPQRIAIIASLTIALIYAALAGFSLPTQRALIMLCVIMLSLYWQRHVKKSQILAVALLSILLFDPLSVLSPGFWLSFLVVIVILIALSGDSKRRHYWAEASKVHVVTALGLLPVLALFFSGFSILAPFANLVAVPIITLLVVPLVFCAMLSMFLFPVLAGVLFTLLEHILAICWIFLEKLSAFKWSIWQTINIPVDTLILAGVGVFLLILPKGVPGRYLGVLMLLPVFFPRIQHVPPGEIRLTLLDVGQGLSVVVETMNHSLLFDAGARFSETSDMGRTVVLPYLQYRGLKQLDTVIISHGDNDHIGGIDAVLQAMPFGGVLSSVPKKLKRYKAQPCQAGQRWQWDEVSFKLLSPPSAAILNGENNRSCVLQIKTRQFQILLPGDIERAAEQWLLTYYQAELQADVLIAPHHGSKTSSSALFLKALNLDYVLIPAGYLNRYGFPHQAVLQRYQDLKIDWLTTGKAGAVVVKTNGKRMKIEASRKKAGHYWLN
ncbi:DNA internalization-related competence protein ComEC/Rec2 [methane-oxidizing endosymbiont of Gigantopelta aegis]|uniref:DNA internalization-related competence protein ComEC/Rec2 n=1 Tax=methane-oxidizing endosymbiont of Gigantopelta aegis TaxID=2794938 RepID=UPI001BE4E0F3|nr:DNA internalization-related competence protein ComEC/Rec2 [methane-oxidizing endosymbiont of Gigantopelta aegis]